MYSPVELEPKRDLFVPIFVAIATAGYTPIYAYESFKYICIGDVIGGACSP